MSARAGTVHICPQSCGSASAVKAADPAVCLSEPNTVTAHGARGDKVCQDALGRGRRRNAALARVSASGRAQRTRAIRCPSYLKR